MTRDELEQAIKEHIVNCFGFCPLGLVGMIMADVDKYVDMEGEDDWTLTAWI